MTALSSAGSAGTAGLADLELAAENTLARPSAAQLLPGTSQAEGIPRLERLLRKAAATAPAHLAPAARDLVRAGGKRVRPLFALLSARAAAPGKRSRGRVALALAAELIHSATLLHDDVIDDGLTRRGLPSPRIAYGNAVSVLSGDWLLAAALDLALRSGVEGALPALVRTLRELVEGEARQLALRGSTTFTAEDALEVARLKTGSLFAWCGEAGALAAGASPRIVQSLRLFGQRSGCAFQIADDLLDFEADQATLGKAVLADVAEGKPSLPLAIALKRMPVLREEMAALLALNAKRGQPGEGRQPVEGGQPGERGLTEQPDLRDRTRAFAVKLTRTGALGAARRIAEKERDAALLALREVPESSTRELLGQVAESLVTRER